MKKETIDAAKAVAESCVSTRLRTIHRVINGYYNDALRPTGLRAEQLTVLVVVSLMKDVRSGEIARRLSMDASTLSRNIERMKTAGWIGTSKGKDAREQYFRITAKGERILLKSMPAWKQAQKKAESLLGKAGVKLLCDVGEKLQHQT